jgi:DNA-binding CsgD family transcriptional regulator
MAADGASNREIAQAPFVGLRTVETHLTKSYDKLGINGRDGLADALSERSESR